MLPLQDLRVAARSLARTPGFTALAAGVLGLGLAAVVLMFGVLNTTLFRAPPVPDVERVVGLRVTDTARADEDQGLALQDLVAWQRESTSFAVLAGYYGGTVIVSGDGAAERYDGGFVRGSLFDALGQKALLGRVLTDADTRPGAPPAVVLGNRLWRERFGADRAVVGRTMRVNGEVATIVGVMPELEVPIPTGAQLWVAHRGDPVKERRDDASFNGLARLRPDVPLERAQLELSAIQKRLAARDPAAAGLQPDVRPFAMDFLGRRDTRMFYTLFGSVMLVLAIACVNVAGLLLVRGTGRTQEAGVRRALGAGRARLAWQMFAESLVIGALAVLIGLTLAAAGAELMGRYLREVSDGLPPWWTFGLDGRVVLFAVAAAMLSAVLAGLYPALRVSGLDVNSVLRDGARDTGLSTGRIVRWLVVAEIALSCALLTSAGMMIRTALEVSRGDVGVPTAHVFTGRIGLPGSQYPAERQRAMARDFEAGLAAIPGVQRVALVSGAPGLGANPTQFALPDRSYANRADHPRGLLINASPGFFDVFRVELRAGRPLQSGDVDGGLPVAVVNENFVRDVLGGESAVGRRVRVDAQNPESPWVTIVGVVENVRHDDDSRPVADTEPTVYVPIAQMPTRFFTAVVEGRGSPASYATPMRETLRRIDPDLALYWLRTIPELRQQRAGGLTVLGAMFAAFAVITIVLAASGIYGVLAYSVAQGGREIAIRRALGAPDASIVRAVVLRSAWQLGLGLALGVLLAPAAGALVGSALRGSAHDPWIYAIVFGILTASIVVATIVPLRAALRMQPIAALRYA